MSTKSNFSRGRDTLERPLPHCKEAERELLGAIVLSPEAILKILPTLRSDDFFLVPNQRIYRAMEALVSGGKPISTVTLLNHLDGISELESAGGLAYLSALADGIPSVSNVEHYADILKEHAARRRTIYFSQRLCDDAFDGSKSATDTINNAEAELREIRDHAARGSQWREKFHTVDKLPDGEPTLLIDRILPEGISYIGADSGVGKTWFALALARSLTSGNAFLGTWQVREPVNALYLCPEMGAKTFKRRCERFGISDRFFCQTIADGAPLNLADPLLASAIRELKPVVFLDTAIRFNGAQDENSASEHQQFARAIFSLIPMGARAIVCLHHRAKNSSRLDDEMTLQNALRGSGDLGATADSVYALKYDALGNNLSYLKESRKLVRLQVRCVKARDFVPPEDFRVQLDPYIDTRGDLGILTAEVEDPAEAEADKVVKHITDNPRASLRDIANSTGVTKDRAKRMANDHGWHQTKDGWERKGE